MKKQTKTRIVALGRVSTSTQATFVGKSEEIGNYPMLWPF